MSKVLIVVEHRAGTVKDTTFELVSLGRRLAEASGSEPAAVVIGHGIADVARTLARWLPRVIAVEGEALADFRYETHAVALKDVLEREKPLLALAPHTAFGMELFPRLSVECGRPCVTDCIEVGIEGAEVTAARSVYSGKVHARAALAPADGYLATVRSGCYPGAAEAGTPGTVETHPCPALPADLRTEHLGYREAATGAVDITQASLIIAIGRGIKDEENIPQVQALAERLGGVLACSRPVVDKKWLDKERQVGTSGRTVKPKAYLALGISGAFQHMAGIKGGGVLIAVNKDPKAPIFGAADYGVVEDMFKIVDALKAQAGA